MDAAERPSPPEPRDVERGTPSDDLPTPRRQRSTLPTFLFLSFILFMLSNNQNEELVARSQYLDALSMLNYQLSNFTAWMNGTESNYTLPTLDAAILPLRQKLLNFEPRPDPRLESYYANLTGFWKGDLQLHNLTQFNATSEDGEATLIPPWGALANDFLVGANISNATEFTERLGPWNWTRSEKVDISFGDKLVWSRENRTTVSKDIAMIHGKIDFSDPESPGEFRLELNGVHFVTNGTIYAFAEPAGNGMDIRSIVSLVPSTYMNETARVVGVEMANRIAKLKEKIEQGTIEENSNDEGPKSGCSFQFYGQLEHSDIPQPVLQELEDEIEHPTGIPTVPQPDMKLKAVLISKNCAMIYELPEITGMKSNTLYRKITTYSGISTLMYIVLLVLFFRQVSRSRSVTGLSRVSRYPFLIQSLIDAVVFVGHITLAIIADGRTSVSVLAPAALACILFVEEAQFSVLIGQIQAPEDVRAPPPRPVSPPASPPPASTTPQPDSRAQDETIERDEQTAPLLTPTPEPAPAPVPPGTPTLPATTVPPPPSVIHVLWDHFRADPAARLWAFMCFFLVVVLRLVLALSLPFLFIGGMYLFLWSMQIYRAVRRSRTSGLTAEYLVGTSVCRLFYLLYFMTCPNNILDIKPRRWSYGIAVLLILQMFLILLQEHFGPSFFLPKGVGSVKTYDYHPQIPLPDPEAPEQSLGDCAICMDAILVDPALRQRPDEKGEGLARRTGGLFVQSARKSYSLAPCHHLFHTACLERWLAIKNICPQCRRPLPPL